MPTLIERIKHSLPMWRLRCFLINKRDTILCKIARAIPYSIRYWVVINAGVDATTGRWENQIVPELRHHEALERMK